MAQGSRWLYLFPPAPGILRTFLSHTWKLTLTLFTSIFIPCDRHWAFKLFTPKDNYPFPIHILHCEMVASISAHSRPLKTPLTRFKLAPRHIVPRTPTLYLLLCVTLWYWRVLEGGGGQQ
ncbi:hypothetical protein FKM82_024199 [Ascaphus truei]